MICFLSPLTLHIRKALRTITRSASSSTPPGKILEIRPVAGTTGKQAWRAVTGALPGTRYNTLLLTLSEAHADHGPC